MLRYSEASARGRVGHGSFASTLRMTLLAGGRTAVRTLSSKARRFKLCIQSTAMTTTMQPTKLPDHNRTATDFRRPIPRPKVNGIVIDFHCHLLAARHAP